MSLILDALNRARQHENAVPGLATQHPLEQFTARRRQYLLWAALAVAVVVIAFLVFDRLRTPPAPETEIGAPVAELSRNIGSAVDSVTTELKARAAAAEQVQATATTTTAGPAAVAPAPAPAINAMTEPEPPAPSVATPEPSAPPTMRDDAVADLYANRDLEDVPAPRARVSPTSEQRAVQGDPDLQRTAEMERILQEARDEMENASLDEHAAPFLADLSQLTKDTIPTLYYQRHDYSSNASESSVTMNGSTVKAGGNVVPGMKVDEILPDSVVLNFQGTQFRLRALNSWVNL